jgi:HAD superfamily phosphatase (TIGR01668 family)
MADLIPETTKGNKQTTREGLTLTKIIYFLLMPFRPNLLKTYMTVDCFVEVPIDQLKVDGIKGILIDADGTLGPHHARKFSSEVVAHINKMVDHGLKVAIYTNAFEDRFHQFKGINVVTNVLPKPDKRGFEKAMTSFLGLDDPSVVCMIGDNFLTDGGARSAGMHFVHIRPIRGDESFIHSLTRKLAFKFAQFYFPNSFP